MKKSVRIMDLDSGTVYRSLTEAGRALGYLASLTIPKSADENDGVFTARGRRLQILGDNGVYGEDWEEY